MDRTVKVRKMNAQLAAMGCKLCMDSESEKKRDDNYGYFAIYHKAAFDGGGYYAADYLCCIFCDTAAPW